MLIKVALTKDVINQCLALHYNNQPAGKKLRQRLLWIPLILIALAIFLLVDEWRQPVKGSNTYMALSYLGFAIAYYLYVKNRIMKAGKRMLHSLGPNANFSIETFDTELTTCTATEKFSITWQSFTGALIGTQNILLYQSNDTFTMLNRTFFYLAIMKFLSRKC